MAKNKKNNPLFEVVFNVLIPSLILMKLSGDDQLGPVIALVFGLAFPVGYGAMELVKHKKLNFIAGLGFISILLTGGIGLLELDTRWLALKEALIPGLIGIAVFISTFTRYPLVKKMFFNESLFNISLIKQRLSNAGKQIEFEKCLTTSNYLFASTFFFSSAMNYLLTIWIVTSPAGSSQFNEELGRLTLYSYPVIAIPSMLAMMGVFYYAWRQLRNMTGLSSEEILVGK